MAKTNGIYKVNAAFERGYIRGLEMTIKTAGKKMGVNLGEGSKFYKKLVENYTTTFNGKYNTKFNYNDYKSKAKNTEQENNNYPQPPQPNTSTKRIGNVIYTTDNITGKTFGRKVEEHVPSKSNTGYSGEGELAEIYVEYNNLKTPASGNIFEEAGIGGFNDIKQQEPSPKFPESCSTNGLARIGDPNNYNPQTPTNDEEDYKLNPSNDGGGLAGKNYLSEEKYNPGYTGYSGEGGLTGIDNTYVDPETSKSGKKNYNLITGGLAGVNYVQNGSGGGNANKMPPKSEEKKEYWENIRNGVGAALAVGGLTGLILVGGHVLLNDGIIGNTNKPFDGGNTFQKYNESIVNEHNLNNGTDYVNVTNSSTNNITSNDTKMSEDLKKYANMTGMVLDGDGNLTLSEINKDNLTKNSTSKTPTSSGVNYTGKTASLNELIRDGKMDLDLSSYIHSNGTIYFPEIRAKYDTGKFVTYVPKDKMIEKLKKELDETNRYVCCDKVPYNTYGMTKKLNGLPWEIVDSNGNHYIPGDNSYYGTGVGIIGEKFVVGGERGMEGCSCSGSNSGSSNDQMQITPPSQQNFGTNSGSECTGPSCTSQNNSTLIKLENLCSDCGIASM